MKKMVLLCIAALTQMAYASGPYIPPYQPGLPNPQSSNANQGSSGDLMQNIQQQTQQAQQVFQNVNYKSFSTDQDDFMGSDSSDDTGAKLFDFNDSGDSD